MDAVFYFVIQWFSSPSFPALFGTGLLQSRIYSSLPPPSRDNDLDNVPYLFHYFVRNWSSLSFLKYESLRLYQPLFLKPQSEPGFFDHEYALLSLPPLSRQRSWQRAVFACFVMITVIRRSDFLESGPASSLMNLIISSSMSLHPSPTTTTTAWNGHPTSCGSNTFLPRIGSSFSSTCPRLFYLSPVPPSFCSSSLSNRNPLAGSIPSSHFDLSDALRFRYELSTGQCPQLRLHHL